MLLGGKSDALDRAVEPAPGGYIAIDWGTSRRRACRIGARGEVLARYEDARGAADLDPADFPAAIAQIRAILGDLPVFAAGMVGACDGWTDAGYADVPADLEALARRAVSIAPHDVTILPGVAMRHAAMPGVMRGEEVQVLGAAACGMVPPDALVCQPGTHSKWVRLARGRIVSFRTAMTGELFAMLRGSGTLAPLLRAEVADGAAFARGVGRARRGGLAANLFTVRAAVLLGRLDGEDAASFASGLLIGSDVASAGIAPGETVHVLGEAPLAPLYAAAIAQLHGTAPVSLPLEPAFVAAMHRVREMLAARRVTEAICAAI